MAMTNRGDVHSGKIKGCILTVLVFATFFASATSSPITRQVGISENVFITVQNDTYGNEQRVCSIDNMTFEDGDSIPTSSPCEHCICRPPGFACTIISCEYKPGCKAIKRSNQCCPEYQCECEKDGKIYQNGEKILDNDNPCEVCYCQGGDVVCAVIDCYWRSDCQPRYIENRCCPLYDHCPPTQNHPGSLHRLTTSTTTQVPFPSSWFNISMGAVTTPKVPAVSVITSTTSTTTESTTSTTESTTTTTTVPTTTTSTSPTTTTTEEPLSNDIEESKVESIPAIPAPAGSSTTQEQVEATSEHIPVAPESISQVADTVEESSDSPVLAPSVTETVVPEHLMSFTTWEPKLPHSEPTAITSEFIIVPTFTTSEIVKPTTVDQTTQVAPAVQVETTQALEPTTIIEGTTITGTDLVAPTEISAVVVPSAVPTPELTTSEAVFAVSSVPAADQIAPNSATPTYVSITEQPFDVAPAITSVTTEPEPEVATEVAATADDQTSLQTEKVSPQEANMEVEKAPAQEDQVSAQPEKTPSQEESVSIEPEQTTVQSEPVSEDPEKNPAQEQPVAAVEVEKVHEEQVPSEAGHAVAENEIEEAPINEIVPAVADSILDSAVIASEVSEDATTTVPESVVITSTEMNIPIPSMISEPPKKVVDTQVLLEADAVAGEAAVTEIVTTASTNYADDIATLASVSEVVVPESSKVETEVADEPAPATTFAPLTNAVLDDDIQTVQKKPEVPASIEVIEETTLKQSASVEPEVEPEQQDAVDEITTVATLAPVGPQEEQSKVTEVSEAPLKKPESHSEKNAAADDSVVDTAEYTTEKNQSDAQHDVTVDNTFDEAAEPTTQKVQSEFPQDVAGDGTVAEAAEPTTETVKSDSLSDEIEKTTLVSVPAYDAPEVDVKVQTEKINKVQQSETEKQTPGSDEPQTEDKVTEINNDDHFEVTTFAPIAADELKSEPVTVATAGTQPVKVEDLAEDDVTAVTEATVGTSTEKLLVQSEAESEVSNDGPVTEKIMKDDAEIAQINDFAEVQDSTIVYASSNFEDPANDEVIEPTTLRSEPETTASVNVLDELANAKVNQASAEETLKLRLDPSVFADSAETFVKSAEKTNEIIEESNAKPQEESTSLPEALTLRDPQKSAEPESVPSLPEAQALKDAASEIDSVTAMSNDDPEVPTNPPSLLRHHTPEHTHEQKAEAELLAVEETTVAQQSDDTVEVKSQNAPTFVHDEVSENDLPETTVREGIFADALAIAEVVEASTINVVADEAASFVEHVTAVKLPASNHSQEETVRTEDNLVVPIGSLPKENVKKIDPFSEDLSPAGRSDLNLEDTMKSEISSADDSWYWRAMNRVRNLANIFPTVRSRSSRG